MNKRTVYILAALLLTAAGCQGQQPLTPTESSRASIQTAGIKHIGIKCT